jgi:predicted RNA binding protein YcfA (HicA-like mRNA interferase family)
MNLHNLTGKDVIKILRDDGWIEVGIRGSHHYFRHSFKKGKVSVPVHSGRILKVKTVVSIFKCAGMIRREEE